ncbi:MAG: SBBP repeat-containing protein [Leadbetterella sp.]|nr:SBBP repeat-containing protein [Leadbetterella sp.]
MTKTFLRTLCLCFLSVYTIAQNVSILPTGITPAPSGSHPRITNDQILALPSPQKGDLAYDLTFNCLRVFNGSKWLQLMTAQDLGQTSSIAWQLGSNETVSSSGIAKDFSGNIYVAGNFKGTGVFGSTNVNSVGDNDVFLAKYTSEGSLLWVRTAGSSAGDIATDISLDLSGNVLITGYYFDAINFGGNIVSSSGSSDVFAAKYDPSGTVLWAKKVGGSGLDLGNSVDTDASGNVYLGGSFNGSCTFFGVSDITLNSAGGDDGFVAKLDASGNVLWAKSIQGTATQKANDVLILGSDLYVLGTFENTTDLGNSVSLSSGAGNVDIFIAKYDLIGNCQAATGFGGVGTDEASRLAKDNNSNIWACGAIYQSATIGSFILTSAGNYDAFFVKLNSSLSILNAKLFGGSNNDKANDMGSDAEGNVFLVGEFAGTLTNGSKLITSNGSSDVFVSKFTNSGFPTLLQNYGGSDFDSARRINVGSNLFITGVFSQTVNFGTILTSSGTPLNGFVMRVVE